MNSSQRDVVWKSMKRILAGCGAEESVLTEESCIGDPELELSSVRFIQAMVELENAFEVELDVRNVWNGDRRPLSELLDYIEAALPEAGA
ncbi:hypothetical protein YDYSG_43070 [Paenibacillus tyrfis]|uniref:hypothetical protein n=1 Tax=Paenibacillus tyrfis TaxID=1501230 RepID=UPI0024932B06|nr:hypothetical protein [Paenibacillus tyrfis]GLI08277.1 hypothetical protein YDYSG_43070 [Paenibacillus tyrfis]